ncbi:hypothetical protein XTALMG727_3312 [Xanthomonas translucens pv. arrhenatheri LMG 727]|uniref:Uncharacterized protein n=1 Tax=Xanthomonas graminis pv. arrhenatheri LMG 727 TaxID=1195923 RepID=A0A0K3A3T9_9XANT|nr:hypothetical protein XTALMG727_3312 [Xanthomonas translucens pv. arrhenatheri LMG 727]
MCVSISYCSSAVLAEVLPQPMSRCSSTATSWPCAISSSAIKAAVMPPPTIATSQRRSLCNCGKLCIRPLRTDQKG